MRLNQVQSAAISKCWFRQCHDRIQSGILFATVASFTDNVVRFEDVEPVHGIACCQAGAICHARSACMSVWEGLGAFARYSLPLSCPHPFSNFE